MDLQDLKRWHWMVIGLLAGSLWAATKLFYGIAPDGETATGTFEMVLMTTKDAPAFVDMFDNGNVYVTDLEIHPPMTDDSPSDVPNVSQRIQWVSGTIGRRRFKREAREWQTRPLRFKAQVPFVPTPKFDWVAQDWVPYGRFKITPGYVKPTSKSYPTIQDYFAELNRKYGSNSVKYRYDWWESRSAIMTIYPLGGLILIGGVWPTVIGLLVGAGLGSKAKQESFDLSRYQGSSTTAATKSAGVTDQDRQQLAAMNADLEKNLGDTARVSAATAVRAIVGPAIRELTPDATEGNNDVQTPASKAKSYGASRADFYPTEIHPEEKKE